MSFFEALEKWFHPSLNKDAKNQDEEFFCENNPSLIDCQDARSKHSYFIHMYKKIKNPDAPGGYVGLNISADLAAEALRQVGFKAESIGVVDDNDIDAVLFKERPSHLVLKAFWVRPEKLELLATRYPSCQFLVCCHSKPSFLAQETNGFLRLNEMIKVSKKFPNVRVAANNLETADSFANAFNDDVVFLPNVLPDFQYPELVEILDGDLIRIGLFCAIRPLKNILNQAMAAINYAHNYGKDLELHILIGRNEMGGDVTLKNLRDLFKNINSSRYALIEHQWMCYEDFLHLIQQMDFGLQVSFTESFNIVSYDFIKQGVPIIVSNAIDWMPKEFMAKADSIQEIEKTIKRIISMNCCEKENLINKAACSWRLYNEMGLRIYHKLAHQTRKW